MTHKPLYAKKHHRYWLLILIIIVALSVLGKKFFVFDADSIIEKSELKNRSFANKVVEITAPKSGIKAYWMAEKSNPIVSMSFIFAGSGSIQDDKKGTANFTAAMMTEGNDELSSNDFKEKLEEYAISIAFSANKDDFVGSMVTLKENLPLAADLLHKALVAPRMDENDFVRTKGQLLQSLDYMMEKPQYRLKKKVNQEVFGSHAYAYDVIGVTSDVKGISVADMRSFMANKLTKDRVYVGIAGDITQTEAEELIDNVFADLPEKGNDKKLEVPNIDFSARVVNVEDNELAQVLTTIIAPSVARLDRDFYPLYVANYVFGGAGLSSRVNKAAREKEGLTYGAHTSMSLLHKAPLLVGGFSTTPQNFEQMSKIFADEWQKMGNEGISNDELAAAKNYLINSYNLRFADIGTLSSILVSMQRENLGIDFLQKRNLYVEQVTLERVNQVAKQYFVSENLVMVNMGNIQQKGSKDEQSSK